MVYTVTICKPKFKLRSFITLLGRFLKPLNSLNGIFGNFISVGIHEPKIVLR